MTADRSATPSNQPESDADADSLRRFLFERLAVRGAVVRLNQVWQTVQERRDYPPAVRLLMGQALAAAALLHATIKYDGRLTLQVQSSDSSQGALSLLVVQCSSQGELRGVARWRESAAAALSAQHAPLSTLCGDGTLVMTLEPEPKTAAKSVGDERYQGVVPLVGATFIDALEHYFSQSEQLPTRLHVIANQATAAGFMIQRLPMDGGQINQDGVDPDGWNRVQQLSATLTDDELYRLDSAVLVRRLFHEETLRLFEPQPLGFRCSCSRSRTAAMLVGLGQQEVRDIISEQGAVEVGCEFCGMRYTFDVVDAERLFSGGDTPQPAVPSTRH